MSFFKNIEDILKHNYSSRNLEAMMYYYGLDLELYRTVKDTHTDVYGNNAGNKVSIVAEFKGILISDDFFTQAPSFAGGFEEGFLYTNFKGVSISDVVAIKSSDNRSRRYKVITVEAFGQQDEVFKRYKLSNLGE